MIRRPFMTLLPYLAAACVSALFFLVSPSAAEIFYQPPRPVYGLIQAKDISLHFAPKKRALDIRVTYPAAGRNLPVILWSHGAFGSRDAYGPLVNYWAAHGYVVIQPTHQDSISKGTLPSLSNPLAFREWDTRPQEISYLIDHVDDIIAQVPDLATVMDRQTIGAGGHSYGAHTSMLLAGITVKTGLINKKRKTFGDDRIRAFAIISPQGTGRLMDEQSYATLRAPALFVTGSHDEVGANPPPYTWRLQPFLFAPPHDKYLLFIDGAYHNFGGISGRNFRWSGAPDPEQVAVIQRTTLAFFEAYLKNDLAALDYLRHNQLASLSRGKFQITAK